jgi:single-stranded-DNA-specific exonuclease
LYSNNKKSFTGKKWSFRQEETQGIANLKAVLNISVPLATIMIQRGLNLSDVGRDFLYPTLQSLPSPFLMKGMQDAVEIIHQGMVGRKPIVIYGDYDVDGVTATAVLINFFADCGVSCHFCHPDRFQNGYGLKAELVETLVPESTGIVITVDCGISDLAEVNFLRQKGWQVIVTDHHQPPEHLPVAHAILNPWQEGCQFPSKDLAGVGVSFFLAMGLRNYLQQQGYWQGRTPPNLKKFLDLVAVGTIADMVPLRGTNRILTKAGLEVLAATDNPGLSELLAFCHLQPGHPVNHEDVSFQLGPRLNAAGRMGDAKRASTLLSSKDSKIVKHLAEIIENENIARRELTSRLVSEAVNMVMAQGENDKPCLIIHGRDWHLGLLGIISSKLVELFFKPTIIFSGSGILKGSARSIPGINIHETIAACADTILEYGGHSSAAGLSLREENLSSFVEMANEIVGHQLADCEVQPKLNIDFVINDGTNYSDLESACTMLAPFGQGNADPIFTTDKPCRLRNIQVIGKEKNHLRFSAYVAGRWIDGVGFGFANLVNHALNGEALLSLAFNLKENRFNGQIKPQILLHDALV